jgi:hypothetical protein
MEEKTGSMTRAEFTQRTFLAAHKSAVDSKRYDREDEIRFASDRALDASEWFVQHFTDKGDIK